MVDVRGFWGIEISFFTFRKEDGSDSFGLKKKRGFNETLNRFPSYSRGAEALMQVTAPYPDSVDLAANGGRLKQRTDMDPTAVSH